MFVYDDQSSYCWFNPASFESLDQFYLVGVVIGLAIYNSTILDLPLPLAVYKKLLNTPVTLEDLATFRPVRGMTDHFWAWFPIVISTHICRILFLTRTRIWRKDLTNFWTMRMTTSRMCSALILSALTKHMARVWRFLWCPMVQTTLWPTITSGNMSSVTPISSWTAAFPM